MENEDSFVCNMVMDNLLGEHVRAHGFEVKRAEPGGTIFRIGSPLDWAADSIFMLAANARHYRIKPADVAILLTENDQGRYVVASARPRTRGKRRPLEPGKRQWASPLDPMPLAETRPWPIRVTVRFLTM
jgi:hypothetical protein